MPSSPTRRLAAAQLIRLTICCLSFLLTSAGCERQEVTRANKPQRTQRLRKRPSRSLAAAITVRFSNSGVEPGSARLGYDRLQVSALFADADRRDSHLLGDLVGRTLRGPRVGQLDSCVRTPGPWLTGAARPGPAPRAWLQLLDVGNLILTAGSHRLPLRISLVPSLFSAVRGVRYDGDIDHSRAWLAAPVLRLEGTGGDGVAPFAAEIKVPRPVRLTYVGDQRVRGGAVSGVQAKGNLPLRWGSVDGGAVLEVLVGSEQGAGSDWLRCRLKDDGAFTVPSVLLSTLPRRTVKRPWLIVLVRSRAAKVPGFAGKPLLLELVDAVRVRPSAALAE
ncbi:MAG: hypothetical protein KC502_01440 [Myxococcales bacterium]|nr:hypothetical protein [Myxococcales bacterium]